MKLLFTILVASLLSFSNAYSCAPDRQTLEEILNTHIENLDSHFSATGEQVKIAQSNIVEATKELTKNPPTFDNIEVIKSKDKTVIVLFLEGDCIGSGDGVYIAGVTTSKDFFTRLGLPDVYTKLIEVGL